MPLGPVTVGDTVVLTLPVAQLDHKALLLEVVVGETGFELVVVLETLFQFDHVVETVLVAADVVVTLFVIVVVVVMIAQTGVAIGVTVEQTEVVTGRLG